MYETKILVQNVVFGRGGEGGTIYVYIYTFSRAYSPYWWFTYYANTVKVAVMFPYLKCSATGVG